jgi:hypothetical protein
VSGPAALSRSAALGKGFYMRNVGVLLLGLCMLVAVSIVLGLTLAAISLATGAESSAAGWFARVAPAFFLLGLYPLIFINITLMYYDLKVRKEAYDLRALAEDLQR